MKPARRLAALAALLAPASAWGQASPSPYTNAQRYDAMGHVTGTIAADPDGSGGLHHLAVRNSFDGAGRLIRVETGELASWQSEAVAPAGWSGFTIFRTSELSYDALGRKTREQVREGAAGTIRTVTQLSYDVMGRLECTAVRMNPAAFASLPASACTLGAAGSDGPDRITRSFYDAAGQRLQLREGVGTADEGTEASWAYNLNGQATAVIDGNGNRADLRYDGHARQDRWTFPSATRPAAFNDATAATALASAGSVNAADYEEYALDPNGNRTDLRKRDGRHILYAYDALNRVTAKTYPQGGATAVHYGYNLQGLQLSARFGSQSGAGITNSFDGFGRLAATTSDLGGTSRTLVSQYDANGNRTRITHPGGAYFDTQYDGLNRPFYLLHSGWSGLAYMSYRPYGLPGALGHAAQTDYGHDGIQRQSALAHGFSGGTGLVVWSYGRNAAGQINAIARDNDAFAWTGHYATARAYTTNGLSQYSAAGGASFSYDANGNLTSDGTTTYVYDVENRLVSTSAGAALAYDPLGRLYEASRAGATTRFLYDGDALAAEYDAAGAMLRRHVHWVGADVPLVTFDGATLDTPRFLFADHQGSVVALAGASGATYAVNAYDEYGIPASANQGRFQYTGQIWLSEIGMYHYKARVYSPYLGRFLQIDPVGYDDQFNLYAYVANDPVNHTDPDGKTCRRLPNGQYQCRIDNVDRARLTRAQAERVRRFEATYSRAVNRLMARDRQVVVGATGSRQDSSFRVSSREVGRALATTQFSYTPGSSNRDASMDTGGHPARGTLNIRLHERGIDSNERDVTHEGLHATMSEVRYNVLARLLGYEPYRTQHQIPYNNAAADLLGEPR